ncbi:MAG: glycosyltransferase [Bacteroidetes bacterium]|nr:glycosyltransferase [Bacteroidota bacterium]
MGTPLVSVILLTYNHEKYIRQCLKSVISQKTIFNFEVIIGEDCSKDNTLDICKEFKQQYPELIVLLLRKKNLGLGRNLIDTLSYAKGQYIAFQEGDDYWTDDLKLQKQVDILLKNEEIIAVTHNSNEIGNNHKILINNPKQIYSLKETSKGRLFHTNSWMIRKEFIVDFEFYYDNLICWDILMELKIFEKGKVYFINEILSVWRRHEDGNSMKIPLRIQYIHFENLYKRLLNEAKNLNDSFLIRHYKLTLSNFYSIFALEIAKRDKVLHIKAILNSIFYQILNKTKNKYFLLRLAKTYFKANFS